MNIMMFFETFEGAAISTPALLREQATGCTRTGGDETVPQSSCRLNDQSKFLNGFIFQDFFNR